MKYIPTPSYMNGTAYNNAVPLIGGGLGCYNPYMDPRYIRQQQEAELKRQQQEYQNQVDAMTSIIRSANTLNGRETDEEALSRYFARPDTEQYNQYMEEQQYLSTMDQIIVASQQQKEYERQREEAIAKEMAEREESHESLYEFLKGSARERYIQTLEQRGARMYQMKNLYDKSAYSRLLQVQEGNSRNNMFNALNPLVTIDDMEITLPQSLQNERELKRKQFMESIMAQDKGW